MSGLRIIDVEQGTDEWLEARRGMITASTVGQLVTPRTIQPAANFESWVLVARLAAERITAASRGDRLPIANPGDEIEIARAYHLMLEKAA